MLPNYTRLTNGVIKQENVHKIDYNKDYISNFIEHTKKEVEGMTALRIGHLISCIGHIPSSILDFGYGQGHFIGACANFTSAYAYDIADTPLPNNVKPHLSNNFYELITFYDSLEHVDDIYQTILNLNCKYVIISVPWCHYFSDDWFENWKHRKINEHLWHFDKNSLEKFMKECGFVLKSFCHIEDVIRKPVSEDPNILTAFFEK